VYISAKVDYALRALLTLAAADGVPIRAELIASEQDLPHRFLENILAGLRREGIVVLLRQADGGYRLARPASTITVADVIRAVDGPLAEVRGEPPEDAVYEGPARHLRDVWVAVRAALRDVLEQLTLANVLAGDLPPGVRELLERPGAWERRAPGIA